MKAFDCYPSPLLICPQETEGHLEKVTLSVLSIHWVLENVKQARSRQL